MEEFLPLFFLPVPVFEPVGGCSMTIYISAEGEEDLNALLSIKVSFQQSRRRVFCLSFVNSHRMFVETRLDSLWCAQSRSKR